MKLSFRIARYLLLPLSLFLYISCGDTANEPDFSDPRGRQLESLYQNAITPSHHAFKRSAETLNEAIADFTRMPTEEGLEVARAAWQATTRQWKRTETYNFGQVANFFLHTRIHRWPTNTEGLLENIDTDEDIDQAYISSRGSSIIGLAAIEYLLFREDVAATTMTFITDEKQRNYLLELSNYVSVIAGEVDVLWEEEEIVFTSNTDLRIDGGQNVLVNGLIAQLDNTLRFRLRTPSGEETGEAPDPSLVEAPYAGYSLPLIEAGFSEWKIAYYGGPDRGIAYGFDDYLTELGNTTVSPRIDAAIANIDANLMALNTNTLSLQDLLTSNLPAVEQLTEDFKALLVLMRVDLSSTIGVILTVNDADGD